jgi:hypothetical protein
MVTVSLRLSRQLASVNIIVGVYPLLGRRDDGFYVAQNMGIALSFLLLDVATNTVTVTCLRM